MGGALAALAAAHLGPSNVQGLYTYGCPRVGNAAFGGELPTGSHHRFVHRDDWVPTLPPEFLGYVHAGELQHVTGSPPRNLLEHLSQYARELAPVLGDMDREPGLNHRDLPFLFSGLADHMPVYYATLLWNTLLKA
jgi:hypothetical protein